MAGSDYVHGEMEIDEQVRTWDGFVKLTVWGSALIMLLVGYSTFTVAMGMHWMVALAICAIGGFAAGAAMKMGAAWNATVFLLAGLAVVVQIIIMITSAML